MFELALQVMRRRWLLSLGIVGMMVLTLLNTAATLGLISYVGTGYSKSLEENLYKASYYHPGSLPREVIESLVSEIDLYGFTPYWQSYGFSRIYQREAEESFTFLPIKVVTYAPSWRLPLVSGNLPQKGRDLLINQYMADTYGLRVGDTLSFAGYGRLNSFEICGVLSDSHYETRHMDQQRVFAGDLGSDNPPTGIAFDLRESEEERKLLNAFEMLKGKPLVTEYYTVKWFRSMQLRPQLMTLAIALSVWLIQLVMIVYLVSQVLRQLVQSHPHSMSLQRHMRLDYLDVYLNYFMLLLGLAFLVSAIVLRPYLLNLSVALDLDIDSLSSWRLLVIHGIGLGFWMNILVLINAVLQRLFVRNRDRLNWYELHRIRRRQPMMLISRLGGIITINTLIALLLLISFESSHIADDLLAHPSIWGFPDQKVNINVMQRSDIPGYAFHPIVIEGPELVYAKGVATSHGLADFDIQLISGRLPKDPSEIVVGMGLVDEATDLGERLRFYAPEGKVYEATIVGIGNALFEEGNILGYISKEPSTFLFESEASTYQIDYRKSVKRHYAHVVESVKGFIVPLISSMVLMGFGILLVFHGNLNTVLLPYRRIFRVLQPTWIPGLFVSFVSSVIVSVSCFLLAYTTWHYGILPAVNHITVDLGLDLISMKSYSGISWLGAFVLILVNTMIGFVYVSNESKLWGNGFLDR